MTFLTSHKAEPLGMLGWLHGALVWLMSEGVDGSQNCLNGSFGIGRHENRRRDNRLDG